MENISMQKLKGQRMTPAEKFVLDTIKGAKPGENNEYSWEVNAHSQISWYNKDGLWLFMQNFDLGVLSVNWTSFWLVLNEKYNLDFDEIEQLLTKLLYKYTNNGELEITL